MKNNFVSNVSQQMAQGKQPTPEMQQQANQVVNGWMSALREDRKGIFQADLLRSFVFVLLAGGLCWFYFRGKIKAVVLLSGLLVLEFTYDLAGRRQKISERRQLYRSRNNSEVSFTPSDADNQINADPEKNFEYWILQAKTRFSLHGLLIFIILWEDIIRPNLHFTMISLNISCSKAIRCVYNMLNTKYVIQKGQDGKDWPYPIPELLGPAGWFQIFIL